MLQCYSGHDIDYHRICLGEQILLLEYQSVSNEMLGEIS